MRGNHKCQAALLAIGALLLVAETARGWSAGHPWIRKWAVERLPEWQEQYFGKAHLQKMSEDYLYLQDWNASYGRKDLDTYCKIPGLNIGLHDVNSNAGDTARGIQWYLQQIAGHMQAGKADEAMKYLGVLCHWMEDPGSPTAHSSPIGESALRELLPPPRDMENCNYLYGAGWIGLEGAHLHKAGKVMIPNVPYTPRLLGASIPEASARLTNLQRRLRRNGARYIIPLIQARLAGDDDALHKLTSETLLYNGKLVADVIYTAGCLAGGKVDPDEAKALSSVPLTEYVPDRPGDLTSHPYYAVHFLVNQAMDAKRKLHPLKFAGGGPVADAVQGFGAGAPVSLNFKLAPGGVYHRLSVRVGLHPAAGAKGKVLFRVLVNGKEAARSKPMASGDPPVALTASLPNRLLNALTLQTSAAAGSHPEHNLAVWGDPVLLRSDDPGAALVPLPAKTPAKRTVSPARSTTPTSKVLDGRTIAKWTWADPRPLVNSADPGKYRAATHNKAAAGKGRAAVADGGTLGGPNSQKDDDFFTLGKIAELQGAGAFAWTFDNLRFNREGHHCLAGSIQNGYGPGSLFIIAANVKDTASAATFDVRLWGRGASGGSADTSTRFEGQSLQPGKNCDVQVVFDASRGAESSVGLRVRPGDSDTWGKIVWLTNDVVRLNPGYLKEADAQPAYLGKYADVSSMAGHFSVGTVALIVPSP